MGVKKVMVLIQCRVYVDLVQGSVIDIVILFQQVIIFVFFSYVCKVDIVGVFFLCCGVVEVIEVVVYGDESIFWVVGCLIDEIKFLLGMIIGVVVWGNDVMIVNNNLWIEQGDYVIMFLIDKKFIFDVERLFQLSFFFL